jgi:AbrB family looped-hinge helix DNA binding protein
MALAHSKVTAQGQPSVPANVRKRLGIGPGSVIEWSEEGEQLVVRRAGKFSSEEIHRTLFPEGPPKPATSEDMKEAIRGDVKNRYSGTRARD